MSDFVFNIAKGMVRAYHDRVVGNDPANSELVVVLVKYTNLEAAATLKDYDNLSLLLAGSTDECDFTNYARKHLRDSGGDYQITASTVDDSAETAAADMPDITWTSAGGASNNEIGGLLICYDNDSTTGNDTNVIPLTFHDFHVTTDGTNLTAQVPTAGYFGAS